MNPFKTRLGFDSLESREVPAALANFNTANGALTITIDPRSDGQTYCAVNNYFGSLQVNNKLVTAANGRVIRPIEVHSITVNGSETGDTIDLSNVSSEARSGFANLDRKVTINGFGGNDKINGSQFSDVINGGANDDTIRGKGGDDTLNGDSGNDWLYGDEGRNTLDGGSGNDNLFGFNSINSMNVYIGGSDYDTVWDFSNSRDRVASGVERIGGRIR